MHPNIESADTDGALADAHEHSTAILDILDDFAARATGLDATQRAVMNILDDFDVERRKVEVVNEELRGQIVERIRVEETLRSASIAAEAAGARIDAAQRAVLNILDDATTETLRLNDTQRAILNILDDDEGERQQFASTQKAILNILDDSADEKSQSKDLQLAALNILDDVEIERQKVEYMNGELREQIVERTRVEEALRRASAATEAANRELEAFSYSVAHDLRAPLRSIDGFSQALLEDCAEQLPQEGVTYLGFVRESAQHMAQLIDDLLSMSRVARSEFNRSTVNLAAVARHVVTRLMRDHPDRSVELIIPQEIMVAGDARLLELALENLLGNAWKFTRKRTPAHIEFGEMPDGLPTVYFVRDNGAGFNMAFAGKLFAVFQRLHTVTEFEGTGIGLANVERIIHRHGGRIWAEGEVDRGATFYFTLEEAA